MNFIMKNVSLTAIILMLFTISSCTVKEEEDVKDEVLTEKPLDTPVTGKIYGTTFTINSKGGYANNYTSNDVESVDIYLTAEEVGCDAPSGTKFPAIISTPRAIGTHTIKTSIYFKDPKSTNSVTVSNVTVEIISIGTTVVGIVMGSASTSDNIINGKFEVPYCK